MLCILYVENLPEVPSEINVYIFQTIITIFKLLLVAVVCYYSLYMY